MNGGIHIIANQTFTHDDGILVVISVPCHIGNGYVLSKCQLAALHGWAIGKDIPLFDALSLGNDRTLVDVGSVVGTLEFTQTVFSAVSVILTDDDSLRVNIFHDTVFSCDDTDTGVFCDFKFHTGSDIRRMRLQKRNGLTLHVRTHEGTGSIIVFQERYTSSRNGYDLFRRNVGQLYLFTSCDDGISGFTCNDMLVDQTAFNNLVGLCDYIIGFFIRRQVKCLFLYGSIRIYNTVRCLNKAVFIDFSIRRQIGNQTDVWTFRCLDRTDTPIVRAVNVTNLVARTVTGDTARSQCGNTTLVCQLSKRILLIHELRQLRRGEEFLDCRCQRTDIGQLLRCQGCDIRNGHTLLNHTLHTA